MRLPLLLALLALAAALSGCGGGDGPASQRDAERVTLSLDFTPNAVHAPIYAARRDGRDEREGIDLQIRKPGPGPDALKLITAGKVDLGVLDIHDLAIAREQGADLVAIGALVGKPLASSARATSRARRSASPACRRTRRSCARSSSTTAPTTTASSRSRSASPPSPGC